ncbi:hypothetical protein JKG47_15770 [Acidithiobacillus sp. MC6.1]|nr:hypothetical protein [Acidithiobacillus sp. MC6.1]
MDLTPYVVKGMPVDILFSLSLRLPLLRAGRGFHSGFTQALAIQAGFGRLGSEWSPEST